jgi:hypothetical protein
LALLLLFTSRVSSSDLESCGSNSEIVSEPRVVFPVVELRRDAWGLVVVRFTILPDGSTTDAMPLFSSSSMFERAAIEMVLGTGFSRRDHSCSHDLAVELTKDDRDWSVNLLPAPEHLDDPVFRDWVSKQNDLYYSKQ